MNPGPQTPPHHGKIGTFLQFVAFFTENQYMKRFSLFTLCILLLLLGAGLNAQTATATATAPTAKEQTATAAAPTAKTKSATPDTYRTISLGMEIEAVKKELLSDSFFGYRGERDLSLLPTQNRSLIETVGTSFISRSWFQFYKDTLYIMTFNIDPSKVDYYSVYTSLVQKYGEPLSLDPRKAQWGDDTVTLTLERPLTVKYVDTAVFTSLLDKSGTEKAATDMLRETFINEF